MLDDGDGGLLEFLHQRPGGVEIDEIVVGKLLALKLFRAGEARHRLTGRNIERCGLMRIFAVAHRLAAFERNMNAFG